ncbi:unnamed protein product [Boreogadus saida]
MRTDCKVEFETQLRLYREILPVIGHRGEGQLSYNYGDMKCGAGSCPPNQKTDKACHQWGVRQESGLYSCLRMLCDYGLAGESCVVVTALVREDDLLLESGGVFRKRWGTSPLSPTSFSLRHMENIQYSYVSLHLHLPPPFLENGAAYGSGSFLLLRLHFAAQHPSHYTSQVERWLMR